jgi:hypothetical protein
MKKLLFLPLLCLSFLVNAQTDFADTAIENPTVDETTPDRLILKANVVSNEVGNNASRSVKIVILLPHARVYSYSARTENGTPLSCTLMRYTNGVHPAGYIICNGGNIQRSSSSSPNRVVKIKVVTAVPDPAIVGNNPTNFGILTYNLLPDNNMKNNSWTWQ